MNAIAYFSQNDKMQGASGGPQSGIIIPFLMDHMIKNSAAPFQMKTLVDLGCGFGNSASLISKIFKFEEVVCVDGSDNLLRLLNRLKNEFFGNTPVKIHRGNLETEKLPVTDAWASMVSCYGVSMYLASLDNLFSEAARVLETGGIFFLDPHSQACEKSKMVSQSGLESYVHSDKDIRSLGDKYGLLLESYSMSMLNPELGPTVSENYFFFRKN